MILTKSQEKRNTERDKIQNASVKNYINLRHRSKSRRERTINQQLHNKEPLHKHMTLKTHKIDQNGK